MENILKLNSYNFDEELSLFEVNLVSYKSSDIEQSEKFAELNVSTTVYANPIRTTVDLSLRSIIMYHENTVNTEDDEYFPVTEIVFSDSSTMTIFLTYDIFNKFYKNYLKTSDNHIEYEQ